MSQLETRARQQDYSRAYPISSVKTSDLSLLRGGVRPAAEPPNRTGQLPTGLAGCGQAGDFRGRG